MSSTIDERVVEMRFDNRQFESNVQTSLSTLDKLKRSLNLDGAVKGLEGINAASKNCDMSGLSSAVQTVQARFSALEVMAVTALANITNSVINTGKQMLHSLTIEPIKDGFAEYELKMGSIQTIMMSTGASLEDVNKYLNELNTYADRTIYSFADMTSNIGKFTNAGVKLEDAVMAIQGISNEAAVSGANANEASRAMYNFAQALSAGYVKLIDWKSIENANMATVEFKTQLLEAAVAAGTVEKTTDGMYRVLTENNQGSTMDEAIDATKNFNDSLQYQWMTTDVLVNTLRDYADETTDIGKKAFAAAQEVKTFTQLMDTLKEAVGSGWAMTWEILFGDFNEAKAMWTDASNYFGGMIDAMSDARNSMLQGWKDLGGRTAVIDAVKNGFGALVSVVKPVKDAFREIFPPTTSQQLYNMTIALREFTSHLKLSDTASANLKRTFKGIFAVLDIGKQAFSALFKAVTPLFGGFKTLGGGVLSVTGNIGDFLVSIDEFVKKNDIFGKSVQGVIDFVGKAANAFKDFAKEVKDKFNLPDLDAIKKSVTDFLNTLKEKIKIPGLELLHSMLERIHIRMSQVGEAAGDMKGGVIIAIGAMGEALSKCKFLQLLQALWNGVKTIVGGIAQVIGGLADTIIEKLGNADFSGIIDLLNGLSLGSIAVGLTKFINSLSNPLDSLGDIMENVTGILDGVRGCFEEYQNQLKAGTLIKIATAIGILAASIVAISLVDSDKLTGSLGAIAVMMTELIAAMAAFNKLGGVSGKGATKLVVFAGAVLVLSSAVKKMASLSWSELARGLVGVGVLLAELDVFMATAKFNKKAMSNATAMVIFAAAIKVLASAVKSLSGLSWEDMAKGLLGVGVLLAEVDVFLNTAKFSGKAMSTATGMLIMSAALKVLASVCGDFAQMQWGEIGKGLTAVGALLLEVAAFTKLTGNAKHVISSGLALVEIAAAMKIFASAMGDFARFSWQEIAKGLVAMGGALAEVAIATNLMPKNMVGIGTGLIVVGAALEIIADALGKMGKFSWEEIAKGLVAMGGALAELAIGLNLMKGTLAGSAAMLVAATALAVLTPVLSVLGAMSWGGIAKGLITIAGAFTVLGVAGSVLTPLVGTILALSGAFALIGVGVVAIGAGLLAAGLGLSALAVGFTAFAASLTAGATAVVAGLTVIITGVAGLIPAIVAKVGEAIVELCKVITASAPVIGETIKAVVLTLVDVLVECVPAIADGALTLIAGVLEALVAYTPSIVDSIFQFLIAILDGIERNLPKLIQSAINVLMAFFSGVIDALSGIDVDVLVKGIAGIGLLSAIMVALGAVAGLIPQAMAGVLGMGVVIAELALVLAAVGALAQIPGLSWLIGEGGKLLQGIGTAIGQFVGGIVGGFMSGVSSQFPQIGSDLSGFMMNIQPFIEGAKAIDASMMEGVKALSETILILTAADILQGLTSWFTGGSSLSDFAEELVPFGTAMKAYSNAISGINPETVTASATAAKALAEMASNLPNSGGVVGWFMGENDMDQFAAQLVPFGEAMKAYGEAVSGIDGASIESSAIAGQALTELANTVPNTGGVVGWFAGNNDLGDFAEQLVPFGEAMKLYGDSVAGINSESIQASTIAGKALTELANTVPNTGGVVSWFTGNNDLDTFGEQIVPFGEAMKAYGDAVAGIDGEAVTASATAGLALTELANTVPNTGGVVSWFTGNNDLDTFGEQIVVFGAAMKKYGDAVAGIDAEAVTASATAGLALAELSNGLDNSGGVVSWFAGDNDLASFAKSIIPFGEAMKSYSDAVSGINPSAVTASATAAQSLATLEGNLPAIGGLSEIMNGGNSLASFARELIPFGEAMKLYSDAVIGVNPSAVTASALAAQSLARLEENLPDIGGLSEIFMGGNSLAQFAKELIPFGEAMKSYSDAVSGINPGAVTASATAAQSLSELEANLPDVGGISGWITGDTDLGEFAERLIPFGEAMLSYSNAINGINPEAVTASATAAQALAALEANLPKTGGVVSWFAGDNDLESFAKGITPFGEAMKSYSLAVTGINADAVVNSTTAGLALIELAKTLPTTGGVVGWFTGENDLASFASGIVPFGEAMKEYSLAVTGINSDAVINSTTAGKALIELANTVPNTGGVVGWFTGGKDMSQFGEQLTPFGEAMKSYSDAISGIDVEAITNSATAGKALVELANTLPNTGGVVSWFTGSNDIGAFGESLILFGKNFAQYSDYMKNVDAGIVTATTNAASSIVELQKSLPEEGGWFSKDVSLADFGKDMSSFGSYFSSYYAYISGVDTGVLSSVITQTNRLVEMAKGMVGLDVSGMTSFSSALTKLGETGVTGFINAFNNAESKVKAAASNMLTAFINGANAKKSDTTTTFTNIVQAVLTAIKAKQPEFQTVGSTLMVKFIAGVKSQDNTARTTFTTIISGCLTAIKNKYAEFQTVGTQTMIKFIAGVKSQDNNARTTYTNIMNGCLTAIKNKYTEFQTVGTQTMVKFIAGVKSKDNEARTTFTTIISGCLTAIKNKYAEFEAVGRGCMEKLISGVKSKDANVKDSFTSSLSNAVNAVKGYRDQFYSAGSYLVDGFASGISENAYKAEAKARAMAAAAARAAEKELDEHSPSKVGYRIGDYFGVAFVNAIGDYEDKAYDVSSDMATAAKTGLGNAISKIKDFITNGIDAEPTIRPVLDLSNVESRIGKLNTMLSRTQALSISASMNKDRTSEIQNGGGKPNTNSTFTFTQNNYSPKSLSRVELYRQTNNQFSAFERMVKA
ncbi:tape measure protein [Bacteroides acidifaciens]|uniref:tape measure protein n=4 Tax=Bacteroides TaxID=816 RepID=UPI00259B5F97|nr:tape measure protein [Bacteroides acidifaciens]